MSSPVPKDTVVYSRGGAEKGVTTGTTRPCRLEGCTGICVTVRWARGTTYPCTKGMHQRADGAWQID